MKMVSSFLKDLSCFAIYRVGNEWRVVIDLLINSFLATTDTI